jgi:hypothetical protein
MKAPWSSAKDLFEELSQKAVERMEKYKKS